MASKMDSKEMARVKPWKRKTFDLELKARVLRPSCSLVLAMLEFRRRICSYISPPYNTELICPAINDYLVSGRTCCVCNTSNLHKVP